MVLLIAACKVPGEATSEEKDNWIFGGGNVASLSETCTCSCESAKGQSYSDSHMGNNADADHPVKKCGLALTKLRTKFLNNSFFYDLKTDEASQCLEKASCRTEGQQVVNRIITQNDLQGILGVRILVAPPSEAYFTLHEIDKSSSRFEVGEGLLYTTANAKWDPMIVGGKKDSFESRRIIDHAIRDWENSTKQNNSKLK